ncbi:MAG: hypothetical protein DRO40_04455 [Thermoprotei archaeon]|nr:MAG: hypothetical protein DRO40_04455 [Thermoprotei archaeon]
MVKHYKLLCTFKEDLANCIINGKVAEIMGKILDKYKVYELIKRTNTDVFTFDLEIKMPVQERIICNSEMYAEFVWGKERILRFTSINPVEELLCISGDFRIDNYNIIRKVYTKDTPINHDIVEYIEALLNYYNKVLGAKTYENYILLDQTLSNILENPIPPFLRMSEKDSYLWLKDIVYSTLILLNVEERAKAEQLIKHIQSSIVGNEPHLSVYLLKHLLNNKDIIEDNIKKNIPIELKQDGHYIIVENHSDKTFMLSIIGENTTIITKVYGRDKFRVNKDIIGDMTNFIAVTVKDHE